MAHTQKNKLFLANMIPVGSMAWLAASAAKSEKARADFQMLVYIVQIKSIAM